MRLISSHHHLDLDTPTLLVIVSFVLQHIEVKLMKSICDVAEVFMPAHQLDEHYWNVPDKMKDDPSHKPENDST